MKNILFITALFFLTSCSSDVKLLDYVDSKSNFKISVLDSTRNLLDRRLVDLQVSSDKHIHFLEWLGNNTGGWKWDPVSYVPADIIISQGSFRLLYWRDEDHAAIAFWDKDSVPQHYSKHHLNGDLEFLSE